MPRTRLILALVLVGLVPLACQKKIVLTGDPVQEWARCQDLSERRHYDEAVECFEVFKSRYPTSDEGIEADLLIGDNYFRKKEFLLAAEAYKNFAKLHPAHRKLDYATYRTGLSYLRESPRAIDRDQEHLEEAIQYLREAFFLFPQSEYHNVMEERLLEARNRLAARNLYVGRFYYRTGEYLAAIPRFASVIEEYPESPLVPRAYYLMIRSQLKLKRTADARETYHRFVGSYPENPLAKRIGRKLT